MEQRARDFFANYEAANSAADAERIGSLYADVFMFGGPNGVKSVKKEDFLKVIPKMKAYFGSLGLRKTELQSVEASEISSRYWLAKVGWRMTIANDDYLDTVATYILERSENQQLAIVFQIDHQDLATMVKERLADQAP